MSAGGELPSAAHELLGEAPDGTLVVMPCSGQRLFRLIAQHQPRLYDFTSHAARQRPRASRVNEIEHVGLSMWADLTQALAKARRRPAQVVEVALDSGFGFSVARTFATEGHYTVWGSAQDLLAQIASLHRAD